MQPTGFLPTAVPDEFPAYLQWALRQVGSDYRTLRWLYVGGADPYPEDPTPQPPTPSDGGPNRAEVWMLEGIPPRVLVLHLVGMYAVRIDTSSTVVRYTINGDIQRGRMGALKLNPTLAQALEMDKPSEY